MTTLVSSPTGTDVASYLGRASDTVFMAQCATAATMVRELASGYCREIGFSDPAQVPSDLRSVIILRAARMAANPLGYVSETTDGASQTDRFAGGWTLDEQVLLNAYRRRAA